jgi:hypothetical protein
MDLNSLILFSLIPFPNSISLPISLSLLIKKKIPPSFLNLRPFWEKHWAKKGDCVIKFVDNYYCFYNFILKRDNELICFGKKNINSFENLKGAYKIKDKEKLKIIS